MKTKEQMYNYCTSYGLNGIPSIAYPLSWLAKQHFGVIERDLLDNEEAVFCFMAKANVDDFDNHGSNGGNPNSFSSNDVEDEQTKPSKVRTKWVAFALTNQSHLYYGAWKPFSSDSGEVYLSSEKEININIDRSMWFYHSKIDINTLRKSLPNLFQTRENVDKIRKILYGTISALKSHSEGDDGRRVYDQTVLAHEEENNQGGDL